MNHNVLAVLEYSDKTAKRAQYEGFEFAIDAPGRVRVTNGSYGEDAEDHSYTVEVEDGVPTACTCPSDEHRPGACKHRVAVSIRGPIVSAASGTPARADGGVVLPPNTQGKSTEDTRPDDCSCLPTMDADGLGCFECYREGFATANPNATED